MESRKSHEAQLKKGQDMIVGGLDHAWSYKTRVYHAFTIFGLDIRILGCNSQ